MDENNRRQLDDMMGQIRAYRDGTIDLDALIMSLEALLGLMSAPGFWVDAFRMYWGELEQAYSVAVVREEPVDGPEIRRGLQATVNALEWLVGSTLEHGFQSGNVPGFSANDDPTDPTS